MINEVTRVIRIEGREKCQDLGNSHKNNQNNNASSTQHTSDGRSQQHKQKGLVGGGEDIHPETNELTIEEGDFQKDQDNIEEVVKVLTNEESVNEFLARQRLRFVKGKLNDQETKNSMSYDVCRILYLDAELFTHEKWDKNKCKTGPISKSRIDQIWITHEPDVIPVEFSVHSSQMVTNSHHSIISTTLNISGFIKNNFRYCVPDQLQDPVLGNKQQNKRDEKYTDGEEIKRRFNEIWDNVMSAISIAMNIELPMKVVKYPGSRNIRHKLSFADKTMRHTTKLKSLIRKICKDQDFLIAHWIDYWLNRINKYNDDYRRKEYDKFIDKHEELIIPTHDLFSDIWINNVKGVVKQRIKIDKNYLQAQRLSKI
ncbi:unnamed protein product [Rhizophagus irregularis]|uniref:Uncharacterized protein n=1 Tax=Rhizophagus irregularis TaxID=588596 RepID=A0A916EHC8_9GLOM|nr:unnamed protein product [Rhizophagus irregularis]